MCQQVTFAKETGYDIEGREIAKEGRILLRKKTLDLYKYERFAKKVKHEVDVIALLA